MPKKLGENACSLQGTQQGAPVFSPRTVSKSTKSFFSTSSPTCTEVYQYDGVQPTSIASLIGVQSSIKTRYPRLCAEPTGSAVAFSTAYCNISWGNGNSQWAQTGFSRRRNSGSSSITPYRKAEVQGNQYWPIFDTDNPPAEGSVHNYRCELDSTSGTWTFYDNNVQWKSVTDCFGKIQQEEVFHGLERY